jgi:superkiller protein 3
MGDTNMAVFHYRKSIDAKNNYEEAMNNLGVLYQGRRMFDRAQYYYEMGLKVDPTAKKPVKNLTDLFGMKGAYLGSQGNYEAALESYRKSLVYDPGNMQTLNNMASIFSNRKNYDSAMVYLKRAYQIDPRAMMVIENMAAVSFLSGNYARAIEFANKGLAINPGSRKSLGVLADTYQAMGNAAEGSRYRNLYNQAR